MHRRRKNWVRRLDTAMAATSINMRKATTRETNESVASGGHFVSSHVPRRLCTSGWLLPPELFVKICRQVPALFGGTANLRWIMKAVTLICINATMEMQIYTASFFKYIPSHLINLDCLPLYIRYVAFVGLIACRNLNKPKERVNIDFLQKKNILCM